MSDKTDNQINLMDQYLKMVKPDDPFRIDKSPPPPDYSDMGNWAAWPGRLDKADLVPENACCEHRQETAAADVFFLHPTTYFSTSNWNQPPDNARAVEGVDEMVIPGQATVFNGCAKVYAPRYRQATLYAFMDNGEDGHKALELAYQDISRAFQFFLEEVNKDRPFFIGSHSQGSCHSIRLLEEAVDQHPCRDRFIAAYLGGYHIPMDKFSRTLEHIKPSDSSGDVGTVIAWDTCYAGSEGNQQSSPTGHWYPTGWEKGSGKEVLENNLLSWTRDENLVDSSHHLGVLDTGIRLDMTQFIQDKPMGVECKSLRIVDSVKLSAQNRKGMLCIKEDHGDMVKAWSEPLGNLHNFDYSLFYMNIRKNAEHWVKNFFKR